MSYCCFFFFQAEDGIRDRNVTGVQTCALPISRRPQADARQRARGHRRLGRRAVLHEGDREPVVERQLVGGGNPEVLRRTRRSEERRVGKECRSRWWREQYKKR